MRILIFAKEFLNPTETFIYNDVINLSKNHEVAVMTLTRKNAGRFTFEPVHEAHAPIIPGWVKLRRKIEKYGLSLPYKNKSLKRFFQKTIDDFKPDVIHCHYGPVGILLTRNLPHPPCPIFTTFHGFDASQRLRSHPYRTALTRLFSIREVHPLFVSSTMMKNVRDATGWDGDRGSVNYCGIDAEYFTREPHDGDSNVTTFLQISSFSEKKGHRYTIEAFAQSLNTPGKEKQLVLAGAGPYLEECKALCQRLGIEKNVKFEGLVDHKRAKELLNNADVFVHHSVTASNGDMEGIPTAIMEAMAMKLPVLSTLHSGIPELVEHGVNGLLCAERDTRTYAGQIDDVMSWDLLDRNRDKVLKSFSITSHIQHLEQLYQDAVT